MASTKTKIEIVKAELVGADAGADLDWLASIPETFTAREGADAAERALKFSKKAVRDVAFSYSGTLPPPPWPAHPDLIKAQDNLQKIADFFEVVDEKGGRIGKPVTFAKESATVKTGPVLIRYGGDLFREVAKLQEWNGKSATLDDMLKLVPRPGTILFGLSVSTLLLAAAAAYVTSPTVRRWVSKVA